MAKGKTPTPAASQRDICHDGIPYTPTDHPVQDPGVKFAAAYTLDTQEDPTETHSCDAFGPTWRAFLDQSTFTTSCPFPITCLPGKQVGFKHIKFVCVSCMAAAFGREFVSRVDNVLYSRLLQSIHALTARSLAMSTSPRTASGHKAPRFTERASQVLS